MAMTLAEARTQVSQLVDDEAQRKWATSEVDQALKFSISEIVAESLQNGSGLFLTTSTLSASSDGTIDLSSTPPFKIHSVAYLSGNQRLNVKPANRSGNYTFPSMAGIQFEVTLTAKPSLPATGAEDITFCVDGADNSVLEAYLCVKAARHLKPKEGEVIQGLEIRHSELREMIKHLSSGPSLTTIGFSGRLGGYSGIQYQWYQKNNQTIQIVYCN